MKELEDGGGEEEAGDLVSTGHTCFYKYLLLVSYPGHCILWDVKIYAQGDITAYAYCLVTYH